MTKEEAARESFDILSRSANCDHVHEALFYCIIRYRNTEQIRGTYIIQFWCYKLTIIFYQDTTTNSRYHWESNLLWIASIIPAICEMKSPMPGDHNLLRKISPETLSAFPTWVECFRTSRLSAINLANREPFPSMLSSNKACGRSGEVGPCFGDNGGINAHTEARCLFGSSSLWRRETSCISVQVKRILLSFAKIFLPSAIT